MARNQSAAVAEELDPVTEQVADQVTEQQEHEQEQEQQEAANDATDATASEGSDAFEIDSDVAVPFRNTSQVGSKVTATMDKLQPGQSFRVAGKTKDGSVMIQTYYRTANGYNKPAPKDKDGNTKKDDAGNELKPEFVEATRPDRAGRKFRCRTEGDTHYRIWRTE